jgi:hypothetical protein
MLEVEVVDLELHFIYANVNKEGLLINVCWSNCNVILTTYNIIRSSL